MRRLIGPSYVSTGTVIVLLGGLLLLGLCSSVQAGGILHYSFDSGTTDGSLGSTVKDLSPAGHNGTVGGASMSQVLGVFGEALTFNGAGSNVNVGLPLLSTSDSYQPYTIAAWVKSTAGGGMLSQYSGSGDPDRFGTWANSGTSGLAK